MFGNESWPESPSRPGAARIAALALGMYAMVVLASMLLSNPFTDGVEAAARIGNWDTEQITFRRGSYGYRFLYVVAEVDVVVSTAEGGIPVHLEMTKAPLFGWSVRRFDARPGPRFMQ